MVWLEQEKSHWAMGSKQRMIKNPCQHANILGKGRKLTGSFNLNEMRETEQVKKSN
jgi:hypothetical protein